MASVHVLAAAGRSGRLLGHDEAISLLAAAGKSLRMDAYYARLDSVQALRAGELRDLLRPTGDTGPADVWRSLARRDMHPPLYFVALHVLQRVGLDSIVGLRLLGSAAVLLGAWIADRLIWPGAPPGARLLGFLLLSAAPPTIGLAVQLRQYAFVYFGMILSAAAIVSFFEGRGGRGRLVALLSGAPAILLWSQLSTALWIGLCLLALLPSAGRAAARRRRALLAAVPIAAALLVPVLVLCRDRLAGSAADVGARGLAAGPMLAAAREVLRGAGTAWCSLPSRWQATAAVWIAFGMVLAGCGWVVRRGRRVDRILLGLGLAWAIGWTALLAGGGIPAHAVAGKYVLPLALCPLVILVRASGRDRRVRRVATALLCAAALSHAVGLWQMLSMRPDARLLASLRGARGVWFDQPKRGYMLPVAAELAPEATVLIAPAEVALRRWAELASHLPDDRLVRVEIDTVQDGRRGGAARRLHARLRSLYERTDLLRAGPHRTMTEFRRRVAPRGN